MISNKTAMIFGIIPLILSIGITPALPFLDIVQKAEGVNRIVGLYFTDVDEGYACEKQYCSFQRRIA